MTKCKLTDEELMMESVESFVFYKSFFNSIKRLNDSDRLALYDGIVKYGLDGEAPEYGDYRDSIFELIKPQIIANRRKRMNGKKGAAYGVKGGNPNLTPKRLTTSTSPTPNRNGNYNENANSTENENQNNDSTQEANLPWTAYGECGNVSGRACPTLQEVIEYANQIDAVTNPEKFFNHYTGTGWVKQGNIPITNWKAVFNQWNKEDSENDLPI